MSDSLIRVKIAKEPISLKTAIGLEQLRGAGCTKIFREKVTGAWADRRQLLDMLKHLAVGDVVIVTRIDRLARSTL